MWHCLTLYGKFVISSIIYRASPPRHKDITKMRPKKIYFCVLSEICNGLTLCFEGIVVVATNGRYKTNKVDAV